MSQSFSVLHYYYNTTKKEYFWWLLPCVTPAAEENFCTKLVSLTVINSDIKPPSSITSSKYLEGNYSLIWYGLSHMCKFGVCSLGGCFLVFKLPNIKIGISQIQLLHMYGTHQLQLKRDTRGIRVGWPRIAHAILLHACNFVYC